PNIATEMARKAKWYHIVTEKSRVSSNSNSSVAIETRNMAAPRMRILRAGIGTESLEEESPTLISASSSQTVTPREVPREPPCEGRACPERCESGTATRPCFGTSHCVGPNYKSVTG